MFGCASSGPAEIVPMATLKAAFSEAADLKQKAESMQADLLAYDEYTNGIKYLDKAQKGLTDDYNSDYIVESTNRAKNDFQQAIELSATRQKNAPDILQARKASLGAGLKNSPALLKALAKVDDKARDVTDDFSRALNPQEFSRFQKEYLSLEVQAVQFRELNAVNQSIQKAENDDAEDLAPKALNAAMLDVNDATNLIAQSPRDPAVYEQTVNEAIASSVLLTDIMEVIANAKGTPEAVASKIVMQNRQLGALSKNVGELEQNLQTTQSDLTRKEGALEMQSEELKTAKSNLQQAEGTLKMQDVALSRKSTQVRFQNAMNEAVKELPADEAEVYQQGNNLIFRLKKINFPTGSSVVPPASKPLLLKINKIITTMVGAELVVVEGHTDSVGADDLNQVLSRNRAISVSNYLASLAGGYKISYVGYGKSKPIADNDSPEGRAINRRVDLVVTASK
jgi:outer membrane protein OmpA-like peptidoglycan-associated protein